MSFGIEIIKDIYTETLNISLREIKKFLMNPTKYSIKSNLDFLNEPNFLFSAEKIILYKYFSDYNKEGNFEFNKKNIYLFNLLNIEISDSNYIYPLYY